MPFTFYQLAWYFFIYAFLGWCLEVVFCTVNSGQWVNRGFLNGPVCPIYGVGMCVVLLALWPLVHNALLLFLGSMVLTSALELVTGALLERIFGQKWWDYSQEPWNFNGHICLKYSLVWGVLALFCLFLGNPLLVTLTNWIPQSVGRIIVIAVLVLLAADFAGSGAALLQLNGSLKEPSEVSRRWRAVSNALDNAVTRYIQRRMARAYPSLDKERLKQERRKEKVRAQVFAQGCGFYKLTWIFVIAALLGDLFETVFCRFSMGEWQSRSSLLYGPFSIVWGFGAVILTVLLYRYRDRRDGFLFLFGTVLGGAYEYGCSVLSELMFGTVFWDYSHIPFNLGGRINLLYCFFWGIATVVWIKVLYPRMSNLIERLPMKAGKILTWLLAVFMVLNMAVSALAFGRYVERSMDVPAQNSVARFLDDHYPDERIERVYPSAKFVD